LREAVSARNLRGVRRLLRPSSVLRRQWPLLALIVFIALVYFIQVILGASFEDRFMAVPADVVEAFRSLRSGGFSDSYALFTLFSAALLHGDMGHLLGNMLYLWIFAAIAAELLGHRWMLLIFVFTAICGGLCHVALNPESPIPSLGASGAVMGFEGLYLGMAVRWRLPDPHVWPIARPIPPAHLAALGVLGLLMDFAGYIGGEVGVAYGAHLGGFIGGMVMGGAVVPMPRVALPR
jgi:membrane associated rhomboid family serine protease